LCRGENSHANLYGEIGQQCIWIIKCSLVCGSGAVSTLVSSCAVDYVERRVSDMTWYALSGMLLYLLACLINPTYLLTAVVVGRYGLCFAGYISAFVACTVHVKTSTSVLPSLQCYTVGIMFCDYCIIVGCFLVVNTAFLSQIVNYHVAEAKLGRTISITRCM